MFLASALRGREGEKGQIGKIPRKNRENLEKHRESPKKDKRTNRDEGAQIGKPSCLKPPRLVAVNACSYLAPVLMHGDRENRVKLRDIFFYQASEDLLEHLACLVHADAL